MGKALVIFGADFSANGIEVNTKTVDNAWTVKGFIYPENQKGFSDNRFNIKAYYLTAGMTVKYSMTQGTSTTSNQYARVCAGIIAGHVNAPVLNTTGVNLGGTVNVFSSVASNVRFPAIPETEYTASSDETLFVCGNIDDTITVITEV